jgi:hypothetical protein
LATIFSFEKSRKWIIRDGFTGISRSGSGAPIASGLKKSRGALKGLLTSNWSSGIYSNPDGRGRASGGEFILRMAVSEEAARDNTEDWLLPEAARPRSFGELEARVDLALTIAKSSEAAVSEVGAAAIEAAEQARQAAELAERAAIAAQAAASVPVPPLAGPEAGPAQPAAPQQEEWLIRFTHRAERLSARLDRLQHC